MKTEIVKQINVKLEKDDIKSIKKVNALINDLVDKGIEYEKGWYNINDICYNIAEVDNFMDFLKNLACTKIIELT